MKNLEKYVSENIDSFNNEEPSEYMRKNIFDSINKKNKTIIFNTNKKWFIAAAVIIILFSNITFWGYKYWTKTMIENSIAKAVPDFKNADKYYLKQITVLKNSIQTEDANRDIDFTGLEDMIIELKNEMSFAPNFRKKQLAKRIIDGYKTEIKILKKITLKINNIS